MNHNLKAAIFPAWCKLVCTHPLASYPLPLKKTARPRTLLFLFKNRRNRPGRAILNRPFLSLSEKEISL